MQLFSHTNASTTQQDAASTKATLSSGTSLIQSILSTTLGPSGSIKLLTSNSPTSELTATNDGATILKNLLVDSPSAQLLISTSMSQDAEEGDGTTSVAVLGALLVTEGGNINVPGVKVVKGYQMALNRCMEVLDQLIIDDIGNINENIELRQSDNRRAIQSKTSNIEIEKSKESKGKGSNLHNNDLDSSHNKDVSNDGGYKKEKKTSIMDISTDLDNKSNYNNLFNLARTTLSSKILSTSLDHFSKIATDAMINLFPGKDISLINIIKCAGKLEDSFYVEDGFILDKDVEVPTIKYPRILIANTSLDYDKIKIFGAKVQVESVKEMSEIENAEKRRMREKIERICFRKCIKDTPKDKTNNNEGITNEEISSLTVKGERTAERDTKVLSINKEERSTFFDIFVNRQLIYDFPSQVFKDYNITPIEHADFDGTERLSRFLNGSILSSFYEDIKDKDIGRCSQIENIFIGHKRMVKFSGPGRGAGTIVLCGSSKDVLDEAERSIHDALCVLREGKLLPGGGAVEMFLHNELIRYSNTLSDEKSEAVRAFAKALSEIPKIISNNAGMEGEKIRAEIRMRQENGEIFCGVDVRKRMVCDVRTSGIVESYSVKKRVIKSACEAAQMLLKCDGFVKCKPRQRNRE